LALLLGGAAAEDPYMRAWWNFVAPLVGLQRLPVGAEG